LSTSTSAPTHVPCGVCGADQPVPVLFKDGYRIVRCTLCAHVYVNPRPSSAAISELYRDPGYFAGTWYLDYLGNEDNYRRTFRELFDLLARIDGLPRTGRFLDVGCAAGFLLAEARERGWQVEGVELSPTMAQHARTSLGLTVHEGRLEDVELASGRFDVVCFSDSLEHVEDPRAALAWAAELLRPRGALVVMTPNVDSLLARILGARWPHYTPTEHIHYFSPASLRRLALATGFEPAHAGSFGHCWSVGELLRQVPGARQAKELPGALSLLGSGLAQRLLARPVFLDVGDLLFVALRDGSGAG